ncbi:hypothetical protein [Pseudomonas chlororaphis]|uniref:hypothetical protein n=1 Tax=Pseudomonas chlororaphis TaxID=587753 RepID=UPI000F57ADD7|nr:hypothetical protein [Pseudomonas chlororaphis]AZC56248.1 hypothetical protein C4K34_2073 [Pseudomonas chlororaphis subsp. piscium]
MSSQVIMQAVISPSQELYISEDTEKGKATLYCLDCNWDSLGKAFYELPRFYRTTRGCKLAAAKISGEKLKWMKP